MINIKKKQDCCGCTACASICPKHCIAMTEDVEGFLYPAVDKNICVDCNACVKVCPVINTKPAREPIQCYAAINNDIEVLLKSSSGGVFSALVNYVITEKKGVVFGAKWENEVVVHGYAETIEEAARFCGSKYVQSDMGDCFSKVKEFLQSDRFVFFSGTPCEVGGLKSFLKKKYDNLLTVDIACHGVPSPKVLRLYLQDIKNKYNVNTLSLNFKDKSTGWATYSVTAKFGDQILFTEPAVSQNIYMIGYLHELFSRPSCHHCAFKSFRSQADFTLADFWGIDKVLPNVNHSQGVSLLCANSDKSQTLLETMALSCTLSKVVFQDAITNNSALIQSEEPHPQRSLFFKNLQGSNIFDSIRDSMHLKTKTRIMLFLKTQSVFLRKL